MSVTVDKYVDVDAVMKRLAELEEQLAPLLQERDKLQAVLDIVRQPGTTPPGGAGQTHTPRLLGGRALADAAIPFLTRDPQGTSTADILARLQARGVSAVGKNAASTLYTALRRHPQADLIAPNRWRLAD